MKNHEIRHIKENYINTVGELIATLKMLNPEIDMKDIEILRYEEGMVKVFIHGRTISKPLPKKIVNRDTGTLCYDKNGNPHILK